MTTDQRNDDAGPVPHPPADTPVQSQAKPRPAPRATQGTALALGDVEPWTDAVDGAELLDELAAVVRRYVVIPESAAHAAALWVALTYCLEHVPVAVRLVLTSPTRECGKTRMLAVLSSLVRRALPASSISPAALFRVIEAAHPTLLLDEVDNARLNESDEMRALLNSGHSRGTAYVLRTVGDDHEPRQFSTWCAIAMAAIGNLPDTVMSRGVVLRLQRKPRGEDVARYREDRLSADLEPLRQRLMRWAADHGPSLADADPDLPPVLDGRVADNWGALVALADAAGGRWPERARRAAVALSGVVDDEPLSIQLLADLKDLFAGRGADRLASDEIATALKALHDRPWADWRRGAGLSPHGLARLLRPFGVGSRNLREGDRVVKGYDLADLEDAFARYLSIPTATPLQAAPAADETPFSASATPPPVAGAKNLIPPSVGAPCSGVAVGMGELGNGGPSEPPCPFCEGRVLVWAEFHICTDCHRVIEVQS